MKLDQSQADALSEKEIRRLFRNWTSLKALGCHPLAGLNIVKERQRVAGYTQSPAGWGLSLREVLQAALEALKPHAGPPVSEDKEWRPYFILTEQFEHGRAPEWVAEQLHISKGTYYGEQKRALALLADKLQQWEEEQGRLRQPESASSPSLASPLPFLAPPRPAHLLIGRDELMLDLKQQLLGGDERSQLALYGLPGVGKTVLAIELAHDPDIRRHFADGVLWVGLGRQPDVLPLSGIWAAVVGIPIEVIGQLTNLADRAAAIHAAIGQRRMLLIIDDAWQIEAALVFKLGGPHCTHLLTTRLPNVALDFTGGRVTPIRELDLSHGLSLLTQLSPQVVAAEPDEARALVQSVGGLPLALILMGHYLRKQSHTGQPRRLRQALTHLQAAETRLQLAQPQSPLESPASLPLDTPLSLQASIGLNDAALDTPAHQALLDLSLFPSKPNTFSEAAALAVMAAPVSVLDTLVDHGLVESIPPDRYTLHQTIADYAALLGASPEAMERWVNYFVQYVETHANQHKLLERDFSNILVALTAAFDHPLSDLYLRGVNALHLFLETRGLYQMDAQLLLQAQTVTEANQDPVNLALLLYNLGDLNIKWGQFRQAQAYFQRSLSLAEATQARWLAAKCLFDLGLACWYLGGKAEDKNYFGRAWYLFRELGDKFGQGYALNGLGYACVEQAEFIQAKAYLEEAITICREAGNRRGEGWAHFNLGAAYLPLGHFALAQAEWEQCLVIYREINDRRGEGWLFCNLWRLPRQLGQYDQARTIGEQARQIFLELGDYFGEGFATHDLGLIACDIGDETAVTLFEQSLQLFLRLGCRTGESQIYHGLGVWLRRRGDYAQARNYLEQALKLRQETNYTRGISKTLAQLGLVYYHMGKRPLALEQCQQAVHLAQKTGARPNQARVLTCLGRVLTGLGRLDEAVATYQQAVALRRQLGQSHLILEPQAGLARIFLAQGKLGQAQAEVEQILAYLTRSQPSPVQPGHPLPGVEEPDQIHLICRQVLEAGQDSRAQAILPNIYQTHC